MSAYSDRIIADGASNYWRLGETSGTTAMDEKGLANGTISGGVTLAQPGAVTGDKAMMFDGATGKIVSAASVPIPLICTIEAWIKITAAAASIGVHVVFSTRGPSSTGQVVVMYTNAPAGTISLYTPAIVNSSESVANGEWRHVVCIADGTIQSIYIDGIFNNSVTVTARTQSSGGPAGVGWDQQTNQWWNGSLDEVAIYPRALTAPEIAAHYDLRSSSAPVLGKVTSIPLGVPTILAQNVIYALPPRAFVMIAEPSCVLAQNIEGPWSSMIAAGARFIKCTTGASTVTCKVRK